MSFTTAHTPTSPDTMTRPGNLRRTAVVIAVAVLATILYLVPVADPAGAAAVEPASRSERVLGYELINNYRAHHGVPALRYSVTLSRKAQAWAEYMARTGRFVHSNVSDGVPAGWRGLGENIAYNRSVRHAQNALEHSPGHQANILNPRFDNVGVGFAWVGSRLYVVQVFGDYYA